MVLPPDHIPGYSRLQSWYTVARHDWIRKTLPDIELEGICKHSTQNWLDCVFRWMHFLQQQTKINMLKATTNQDLTQALEKTILDASAFRLEYVMFYCLLRRAWQEGKREQLVLPDPFGLCPRVCGDRSGMVEEDELEARVNGIHTRPERRLEQCSPPNMQPTFLTSRCIPQPNGMTWILI